MRILRLVDASWARDRISAACAIDDLTFHFSVWYEDVDFTRLPTDVMDRLAFHVAMFQLNAVASLRPDAIALGPYARFGSPAFVELWQTVFAHVWAQWRWENGLPAYRPEFVDAAGVSAPPVEVVPGPVELLAFCGGGKDSLVALKLLERAGLPFATLGYSHSIYGAAAPQHALLDRVGTRTARVRAERQWIVDDFLDSPVIRLRPELGVTTLTAAETPASVFAALPLALVRGYRHLVLAHEASANSGNLTWKATGEEVNHQWGKSFEAERLLAAYVQRELMAVDYWSVLQPVHDEVIFELLARDAELAPFTHSCNLAKPWCGTCAKCAYVWLQMQAHLPADVVQATFAGRDLGELPENERWFRELLGLAEHSPFECVGSPQEARLALALFPHRGPRLEALAQACGALDPAALARPFLDVGARHAIPPQFATKVLPILRDAAAAAAARIRSAAPTP
ncbi:MAG: hypothetical protein SFX73_32275 [Kofleriaceae bacterium]|nr:hypothetical protein [Kofleriaceae bacterium]